ncbi:hypothetical protein ACTFIW_007694 [Dictyostelium discoideum]
MYERVGVWMSHANFLSLISAASGANKKYWRNILDNQYVVENVEYGTATIKEVYFIERDGRKKLVPKDSKELMRYIEKARLNNDGDGHSHIINQNQCQQYISNHYKADNHSAIIKAYFKTEPKSRIDAIKISKAQLKDNPVPIAMQRESRILQKLMFDTCYMNESSSGNIYCHAVVDCYSRLCYFDASPIRNAESMLSTLKKAISFFGGIPESVQCDNGGENKNCKMTQYCSENNIKIIYSTPGKPHQNGKIERWNGTFKSDLKNTILNNSEVIQAKDWDHHLGSIRDKLNKTRHSSINMSPYKAHYLKDPELPNMTPSEKLTISEYSRDQIDIIINDQFDRNFKRFEQRKQNFVSYEVGTIVAVLYTQKKLNVFSGKDYPYTAMVTGFDREGYSVMWIGDGPIIKGTEECEKDKTVSYKKFPPEDVAFLEFKDINFNQSEELGILFNDMTIDRNDLRYKANVEFREAETSKNKKQRDLELAIRESIEKAVTTEPNIISEVAETFNESTEAINEQIDITSQQVSIQSNTKTKNNLLFDLLFFYLFQLQSDAEFFTNRFLKETSTSDSGPISE